MTLKIHALLIATACLALAPMAQAQTTQQSKMKTCNAEAKASAKKGDERKAFMKSCLSAKPEAKAEMAKAAKPTKP
jgi:psiF repeat